MPFFNNGDYIMTHTLKICELNDQLRKYGLGGKILLTQGVQALGEDAILEILTLMQVSDAFSEDNDPYGEHDFGSINYKGKKVFWKIDYYDQEYLAHSANPADPAITNRVLTVMLAEEY